MRFELAPRGDLAELATRFAEDGYVSIPHFLAGDGAEALRAHLNSRSDWRLVVNAGEKVYDLDWVAMSAEQRAELDRRVHGAAREGFQFRFGSVRVPDSTDERVPGSDPLHAFAEFMRSEPVLALVREVTGRTAIVFADAQATAYHPGDFLTGHDDHVEGKCRELAYVMNLTSKWRVEWGGLLLFHGADGKVAGLSPRFNCLNVFAVPLLHSVSQVTPFAGGVRYSVTGWQRSKLA